MQAQPNEKVDLLAFWGDQIDWYEGAARKWESRAAKIVKRYKDERPETENGKAQMNILWANIQILAPAIYDRAPIPNIDRHNDEDKNANVAAQVLERATSYFINESEKFDDVMKQVVLDRLLPGRATAWVRYSFNENDQISEDESDESNFTETIDLDYVNYKDFGHTYARTWQEVRAVWRRVEMSRAELIERFGEEIGNAIPMDSSSKNKDDKTPDYMKRASVYEIWDKKTKTALWLNRNHSEILDVKPDPLGLTNFFPCPRPIYATLSNDSLFPTPDYVQYQDQAREVDNLTGRINQITKCLKVAGVYDSSSPGLETLLADGVENTLIPVDQWAMFASKGGLEGVIDFIPLKDIMATLQGLYDARDRAKQDLYEVTGISDIIRGATKATETLGAQKLKGQYASLRLDAMQKDVARFARDIVRIYAEIISEHFDISTIKEISNFSLLSELEKRAILLKSQIGQPVDNKESEKMESPSWEDIDFIIKNSTMRSFKISIETDSTIKSDQEAEKASRTEFLSAASQFISNAAQIQNPQLYPLMMDLLRFGVKGFKISRSLEESFDNAQKEIENVVKNPPQQAQDAQSQPAPQQDPAAELALKKYEIDSSIQVEREKIDADSRYKAALVQLDKYKIDIEAGLKDKKIVSDSMAKMEESMKRDDQEDLSESLIQGE